MRNTIRRWLRRLFGADWFGKFRRKNFVSAKRAAEAWEVSERTIQLWDYREPPRWALRRMDRYERLLSGIDPRWEGFRIGWNGRLYGPDRLSITPDHLRHWSCCVQCSWWRREREMDELRVEFQRKKDDRKKDD